MRTKPDSSIRIISQLAFFFFSKRLKKKKNPREKNSTKYESVTDTSHSHQRGVGLGTPLIQVKWDRREEEEDEEGARATQKPEQMALKDREEVAVGGGNHGGSPTELCTSPGRCAKSRRAREHKALWKHQKASVLTTGSECPAPSLVVTGRQRPAGYRILNWCSKAQERIVTGPRSQKVKTAWEVQKLPSP